MDFDETHWSKVIQKPDWYMEFVPYAKAVQDSLGQDTKEAKQFRKIIRHFFERKLQTGRVALADQGPNLDAQREQVDTIVIHHSGKQGYRLSYMNAVQLLNIYAPYFMNPTVREERGLKGKAIWSGHFRDGSQSFLAYHWLMRADGQAKRLLDDNQIGWHAGNWKINRRSIAICLDNDYSEKDPDDELLKKLADFIRQNYPQIEPMNIIGHCEAREGTACPGKNWLTNWKIKLLNYVEVK